MLTRRKFDNVEGRGQGELTFEAVSVEPENYPVNMQ